MVVINKPIAPFVSPPPSNQPMIDVLYQNDEALRSAISNVGMETLRRHNAINDRLDTLEQNVKAIEQLLQEFINKE
jgi:hypothetical protein